MSYLRWLFVILFALLVVIISVQNHGSMSTPLKFKVDLLFYKAETPSMSVYLVAIITFCLGVLVTGSYGIIERFRFKKEIKVLEKNVKEKEKELNSLRNLPVTTEVVSPDKASETD